MARNLLVLLLGAAPHTAAWSTTPVPSAWQCNAHDGSVSKNGVAADVVWTVAGLAGCGERGRVTAQPSATLGRGYHGLGLGLVEPPLRYRMLSNSVARAATFSLIGGGKDVSLNRGFSMCKYES